MRQLDPTPHLGAGASEPPGIVARISMLAARDGDRPALLGPDSVITYAALNVAANRLAHALRRIPPGADPDGARLVAICMAPSVARIVAVIGALQAGFGYVPINPGLQDAGLEAVLAHAGPRCVLADSEVAARLAGLGQRVLDMSALPGDLPDNDPGLHPAPDDVVPAGYPPAEVVLRLRDAAGQTVAPGESGEIEVRSRFMGTGYWKRPDLSQAVFGTMADGVGTYRTGDVGRFDAQGRLVVLGRVDNQIKLRGFRTSPEEIEDVLPMTAGGKLDRQALPDPLPLWRALAAW